MVRSGVRLAGGRPLARESRRRRQRTPILRSVALSEQLGLPVVLKAENLHPHRRGFKIRGAMNKVAKCHPRARPVSQ